MTTHRKGTSLNGYCITGHCGQCPHITVLSQTGQEVVCPCPCHTR